MYIFFFFFSSPLTFSDARLGSPNSKITCHYTLLVKCFLIWLMLSLQRTIHVRMYRLFGNTLPSKNNLLSEIRTRKQSTQKPLKTQQKSFNSLALVSGCAPTRARVTSLLLVTCHSPWEPRWSQIAFCFLLSVLLFVCAFGARLFCFF